MQNNFIYPYSSEELWRKRPHPSRVDENDSDDDASSTTGSPWRAMKRLRVAGPLQDDFREQTCPEIERAVSHTESVASKDEDYANFNKLLGALHLERRNRELVRTTPVQPNNSDSSGLQQHLSQENMVDSQNTMTTPVRGRTRRNQTKLKTQSKLA